MDLNLKSKVAFVGGASRGIGKAIAFELASLGASVIVAARDEGKLSSIVNELPSGTGQTHGFLSVDYSKPNDLKKKVNELLKQIPEVHILIHNTGGPKAGPASTAQLEEYANAFTQHILSGQVLLQSFLEGMKKANYGRIINIISTSVKQPIESLGVSNTIRAAVANWAKTLSFELAEFGITVNNVLPGFTNTDRLTSIIDTRANVAGVPPDQMEKIFKRVVPVHRFAEPEEIAAAVAFLASPAASYINGINLPVDGGRTKSL